MRFRCYDATFTGLKRRTLVKEVELQPQFDFSGCNPGIESLVFVFQKITIS